MLALVPKSMLTVQSSNTPCAKTSHRLVRSVIALAVATVALSAAAQNTNSVSALGNSGPVFDNTAVGVPVLAGTPGPINLGTWTGSEAHFAAASGESLTLRSMVATQGDSNQTQTSSSFNWTTVAGAGSSGLALGDPFTATLSFYIDGRTAAGFGAAFLPGPTTIALPADYSLQSYSSARLRFDMYDLDSPSYEGGAPQARIDYVSAAYVDVGSYSASVYPPDGFQYTNVSHEVQLTYMDPTSGEQSWSGNDYYSASFGVAAPSKEVYDVNTSLLSVSVDTYVGNHLNFEGSLLADIYCNTYAPSGSAPSCAGLSDYGSTFDAELSSSVAGVTFSAYTPGVFTTTPVPEPETYAMLMAGLGILGAVARRRKHEAA